MLLRHDKMTSVNDKICGKISIIILVLFEGAESVFCVLLEVSIFSIEFFDKLSSIRTCSFPTTAARIHNEPSFGNDAFYIILSVALYSGLNIDALMYLKHLIHHN